MASRPGRVWPRSMALTAAPGFAELVRAGARLPTETTVTFSPVQDRLPARALAEWILADRLDVCFQIQLHRAVWPEAERGV